MTIDTRFKIAVLKALGMILWWVAFKMDKLQSGSYLTTVKEIDDLANELKSTSS